MKVNTQNVPLSNGKQRTQRLSTQDTRPLVGRSIGHTSGDHSPSLPPPAARGCGVGDGDGDEDEDARDATRADEEAIAAAIEAAEKHDESRANSGTGIMEWVE